MKQFRNIAGLVTLAIVIGIASAGAARTVSLAAMLENWLLDLRIAVTAPEGPPDPRIGIVAITEDTLATLTYRHPVDRELLARLVRKADAAGAKAIGFDILFDQATEPAKDKAFEDAIRETSIPVYIAHADARDGLTEKQVAFLGAFAPRAGRAYVNLIRDDRDGTVRATLAGREIDGAFRPGMAAALAGLDAPDQRQVIRLRRGENGSLAPFPKYPAHAFHLLPDAWLKDRLLLVGADLPHEDRFATSFVAMHGLKDGTRAGVEIHAQSLADLIDGEPFARTPFAFDSALAAVLALVGLVIGVMSGRMVFKVAGAGVVVAALWASGSWAVGEAGLVIPLVMPTVALAVSTGLGATIAGRRHRAEKRFIRDAMSRYVASTVVDDLQRNPEKLRLGGERRELTLIFTDIAGFTTTSEATPADVLVPILNDYLDGMSGIVMEHGGTVDKFIGDALVAIFGAPIDQPDHAARAVACARALDEFATGFIQDGPAKEIELGITRIGVHTGPAIVGNIGGDKRFDYTAIGDTVNTAARLEGANKYLGTTTCISEVTATAAGETDLRPIGDIVLKGRSTPLRVFAPGSPSRSYADAFKALEQGQSVEGDLRAALDGADSDLAQFHLNRLSAGETGTTIVLDSK